jgi:hypothetical protein
VEIDRALLEGQSLRDIARRTGTTASSLQRHKADHLAPSLVKAYQARENARAEGFRERLETTWEAIQDAMDQARQAVRTREDGTVEDRSLSVLTPLFNQAHRNLELLGRATGELSNDGAPATNVTLIRVLSVPRMPGVQTVHDVPALEPPSADRVVESPAAETTETARSLPAAESRLVDVPANSHTLGIPLRNRR